MNFTPPAPPQARELHGRTVTLRPVDPQPDAAALYPLLHGDEDKEAAWDYLPVGPYPSVDAYAEYLGSCRESREPLFFTIVAADAAAGPSGVPAGTPLGTFSLLSIVPEHGRIEIGFVTFPPLLQRTTHATEAIFLLMRHSFELGYRRLEWKCNALNEPSKRAAERFGFAYEGTFVQHQIVKGRNRDTAWYAITDGRWPALRTAFEAWLDPGNFDASGRQLRSLRALTAGS